MTDTDFEILHQVKGIGEKRYTQIISISLTHNITFVQITDMSADKLKATFNLPINVAHAVELFLKNQQVLSKEISYRGEPSSVYTKITKIQVTDLDYPERLKTVLGSKAPQHIYVWGNLSLIEIPSVGFCGSRKVTEKGLSVTQDAASQFAQLNWTIVSGHAKGVDITAHLNALKGGTSTVIVVAEGLESFKLRNELKPYVTPQNTLIISIFEPKDGWTVWRAMKRNEIIIALSDAMILVEAGITGGTFEAGKQTLRLRRPLFVVEYGQQSEKNAGNAYFLERGAQPILRSSTSGKANLDPVRREVEKHTPKKTEVESQLPLFTD